MQAAPHPDAGTAVDTSHLVELEAGLARKRAALREATTDGERALRRVWVEQAEREVRGERAFLGLTETPDTRECTDDELLAALTFPPAAHRNPEMGAVTGQFRTVGRASRR
ncbi:MAG: hypothetical protein BGO50_01520 [Rhodanobacter sp. 67-28]|mgnify:FL=1|nr:MAG: hypothetical protein BGO50_01520 [Rhodanobacter sp. 67-28]